MLNKSKALFKFDIFNYIVLAILALLALYPFIYILSISLSTSAEAARDGLHLYPKQVSFIAYDMVFRTKQILTGFGNSTFRTVISTFAQIFMTALCAYPLSRKYMPNRKQYMLFVFFTMLFSGGIIPSYLLMKSLHLIDNRLVYVVPGLIGAFNVIIVKNFFQSIPDSLQEAAKIDGANEFYIFYKVILPLSTPVLATIALWTAVGQWNSWFDAMIYINNDSKQVLPIFLQRLIMQDSSQFIELGITNPDKLSFSTQTIKAATIVVTILPIMCVYPFLQKYFVKGIMIGSTKG